LADGDFPDRKIVPVMDNLNTHSPATSYERFGPAVEGGHLGIERAGTAIAAMQGTSLGLLRPAPRI